MPSLNYSKRDPKFKLLKRVFDVIGDRKSQEVYARYGVKNIKMMIFTLKVIYIYQCSLTIILQIRYMR